MSEQSNEIVRCGCRTVELQVTGKPLFRGYCHCKTCQKYTGREYADVSIYRAANVKLGDDATVDFRGYQKPALARRGKCVSCHTPTIEKVPMPLLSDLIIISSDILPEHLLVEPSMHIFYHRRVNDVADSVAKHNGFLKSQLAFMGTLCGALWRTR